MGRDGMKTTLDLLKEGGARPRFFPVVVLRCLVQFAFGEPMEFRSGHSSQLGSSITKHVDRLTCSTRYRVPICVTTVSVLGRKPLILLIGEGFETLKEPLDEPRARLRV